MIMLMAVFLALGGAVVILWLTAWRLQSNRQTRLDKAFSRARYKRQNGVMMGK